MNGWNALKPVAFNTLIIYLALMLGLRLTGKRTLGQMNVADTVAFLILGSAVETAMINGNSALAAGIISALVLIATNFVLGRLLRRLRRLRRAVAGSPALLLYEGRFLDDHLRREAVTRSQVLAALREHGYADPDEVLLAVLEVDGAITIVPKETEMRRTEKHLDPQRSYLDMHAD